MIMHGLCEDYMVYSLCYHSAGDLNLKLHYKYTILTDSKHSSKSSVYIQPIQVFEYHLPWYLRFYGPQQSCARIFRYFCSWKAMINLHMFANFPWFINRYNVVGGLHTRTQGVFCFWYSICFSASCYNCHQEGILFTLNRNLYLWLC